MCMDFWKTSFSIGSLEVSRFIGGPLDGITDSPFRRLVRDFSKKELLYTEMRHVACIANDKGGMKALNFCQSERPLNYQIAVNSVDFIEKACEKIMASGVDCIDVNIGCPARNVIGSGSGSALMADLPRLKLILQTLEKSINIPFTVKIRSGFKVVNAVEVALLAQDCGAQALAIHPRLQTQRFEGRPDYTLVAEVKRALQIPVIVSGGVVNFKMARMVYEQTGADGYLIGRGIWSKPWQLHEMQMHAEQKEYSVGLSMRLTYALKHLDYMLSYYGPKGLFMFRKHLPFYVRGVPEASIVRGSMVVSTSVDEVKEGLIKILGSESGKV